ncbi:MAG: arginine--tRNA ligase [Thermodesulfobacteriota bacterium]
MIKEQIKQALDTCFAAGVAAGAWTAAAEGQYGVEEPRQASHGDFATNMALVIAGTAKKLDPAAKINPRALAERIVHLLQEAGDGLFQSLQIAGPGFINMVVRPEAWQAVLPEVCRQAETYGRTSAGSGRRVLVEFVSANPTGPLSVGHGRQAVLGDCIARLLAATGHDVTREYYFNDAGRQMRVLGESTRARYLELLGRPAQFPEDGYQGEYIRDIARQLAGEHGAALADHVDVKPFRDKAVAVIFEDIKNTLARLDIVFDSYYNEHSLYENGLVDEVIGLLREKELVYDKDGATWFKTSVLGLDQDRVIVKSSGEPTYRLPDIAYHREKFRRGFDWMVNVFGSDHIATVPDVLAGVRALGYDSDKVTVVLHQFVTLLRDGKLVKMSTRRANFVTTDELIDEVGAGVVRFFFLMRKADSQLEFDLTLAASQSQENPVYYVQYAHARLCSIAKQAATQGVDPGSLDAAPLNRLTTVEELRMLKAMSLFPSLVERAALDLEPHRIPFFLQELASEFHSYYNKHRVVSDDADLSRARLWLCAGLRIVFRNGLALIGVDAPETM